jgi:Fur family transcriptional regulator, ferric uptake regulator
MITIINLRKTLRFAGMERSAGKRWIERSHEAMRAEGHRSGGARGAVVELLARQDCCLSAQEIAAELRAAGNAVGIASVYRALDLLDGLALVQRVDTGEGGTKYEAVIPGGHHHHHVVCEICGRVAAFEDKRLEEAIEHLAGRLRHEVSAHDVMIRGACQRCAPRRRVAAEP